MSIFFRVALTLCIALYGTCSVAHASVQITGTRVIYPAGEREVTIRLTNKAEAPRLVQAWVDSGDPTETAENSKAPFTITPPLVRVEPDKGQALRLMHTGEVMPQDRESVYWLNVLEIPPRPQTGENKNYMQFAVRTRIKIFYRPKGLQGTLMGAVDQLTWRLVRQGTGYAIECQNPSPYNVSFNAVGINGMERQSAFSGGMAPARGSQVFPLEGVTQMPAGTAKVVFSVINDFGGFIEREAILSP